MNPPTPAETEATKAAAQSTPVAALEADDWLKDVTPQASCNLDGTCEACQ